MAAFKVGVLGSVENVVVVAEIVSDYPEVPSSSIRCWLQGRGDEFSSDDMLSAIRELLLPQTTLLTPNAPKPAAWPNATTTRANPTPPNAPAA